MTTHSSDDADAAMTGSPPTGGEPGLNPSDWRPMERHPALHDSPPKSASGGEPESIGRSERAETSPIIQHLRSESAARSELLLQQLANIALDLLFLSLWAAIAAALKVMLDYFDANIWVYALSYFGDLCTFVIVASFLAKDLVVSWKQIWQRGW